MDDDYDPNDMEDLPPRRSAFHEHACRCGGDMPGNCPGPANCPLQGGDDAED